MKKHNILISTKTTIIKEKFKNNKCLRVIQWNITH